MPTMLAAVIGGLCLATISGACVAQPPPRRPPMEPAGQSPTGPLAFRHARQVSVEDHDGYRTLTITPRPNPAETFRYTLVRRGVSPPAGADPTRTIEVPVDRVVLADSELIGAVEVLGLHERVVAIPDPDAVTWPVWRQHLDGRRVAAVGRADHLDIERVVSLAPDLVMSYWSVSPTFSAHPALEQAGLRTVVLAPHWETTPLAVAEWVKVFALFFGAEARAEAWFAGVEARYLSLAQRATQAGRRPVVLTWLPARGRWTLAGREALIHRLVSDAGGAFFHEPAGPFVTERVPFEQVLHRGRTADLWLIDWDTPVRDLDGLRELDDRVEGLAAFRRGAVYNRDAQRTDRGRNAFVDQAPLQPDVLLGDVVQILHPELLPDRTLVFYRRLGPRRGDGQGR